ncbi:phytoene/squalene synthase family protein [Nisaea sp.]|uniref:phytoene/squalene synthase family protein n=1 Tax=Nisaea sp. TaxID=2024842 RepID=UPI0032EDEC82
MTIEQEAESDAAAVLATHGRTFHFASLLLPQAMARDCARLYKVCRYLDDIADAENGAGTDAADTLSDLARQSRNAAPKNPVIADLLALSKTYEIDPAVFQALLEGLQSDCGTVLFETESDLLRYAYRVAGTVGQMIAPVLGALDERAPLHAIDLGIAMQLTNIARDIREDAMRGRRYIPGAWINGIQPQDLVEPGNETREIAYRASNHMLDLADRYYESAEKGFCYLPIRSRLAIATAARCYRAIGTRLRRGKPHWWQGRARVGTISKVRIMLVEALPRALRTPRPGAHDRDLHATLEGMPVGYGTTN